MAKSFQQWRRIEVWDNESLASPETLMIGKELYEWCKSNGCITAAAVLSNGIQEHIVKDIFKSDIEVFYSFAEAKEWMLSQPFKRSNQPI